MIFQTWSLLLRTRELVALVLLLLQQVRLFFNFLDVRRHNFLLIAQGLFESSMIKAGAKKTGLDLSEQYLVDCAYGKNGARGCNGAHPFSYPKWLKAQGGQLPHEKSYPYLGSSPKLNCNSAPKKMWNSGAKVSKTTVDWKCNESKLKSLIHSKGAVSVTVYAADNAFSNYKSGVYNKCKKVKEGNHQVLAVGYGTENGVKYWLVKNSWGTNWGEKGYFKIQRGSSIQNTNGKTGMCGIEEVSVLDILVGQ